MVGIVIVSHSAKLAEGVVELASQMSGQEVKLRAAGGVDFDTDTLGTDPMKVVVAIEEVYTDDGVLVLMDLGSAILNAEMALEFLPEAWRTHICLCEAPLVEGAVAAAVQARLGNSLEQVAAEARAALGAKIANLGGAAAIIEPSPPSTTEPQNLIPSTQPDTTQIRLTVHNHLGLHVRPLARLVQLVGGFPKVEVHVANLTKGRGPASARSINALATLGVRQHDEILISLTGAEAEAAANQIQTLAASNFGDEEAPQPFSLPVTVDHQSLETQDGSPSLAAIPASTGIAVGTAHFLRRSLPPVQMRIVNDPEFEWTRYLAAIKKTQAQIQRSRADALRMSDRQTAEIFEAHLLYLEDEALLEPTRATIWEHGINAEWAWQDAIHGLISQYRELDDEYLRARITDVEDVAQQVLANLMDVSIQVTLPTEPGILIAEDLSPSDMTRLTPRLVKGIASATGGATSHSSIIARSLGIPAVVGLGRAILEVEEGTELVLDGSTGQVWIDPDPNLVAVYRKRAEQENAEKQFLLAASARPARTLDGRRIEVAANISGTADARAARKAGAEAAGLFRTEFLFLDRLQAPTEEEQYLVYRATAEAMENHPLIARTLDAGGDKPIPYLNIDPEQNPYLGYRAIRICLDRPDLFKAQLRSIVRVAANHPIKIMFPMVATLSEWRRARSLLNEAINEVRAKGVSLPDRIETGIMVEVPSTAVMADQFAAEVDFFSIGTNDLTQYTLAAERGNPRLSGLADALHPSILNLIHQVVEAAHAHGKWVGVCGEAGGDPMAVPILVGLGVDELSMGALAIPRTKQIIRQLNYAELQQQVLPLLALESAEAVRKAADGLFNLSIS
ncbi:MAG: phosphoenolpyruvate--protein phosphotransferase [Caldilineaceae bacterium]